MDTTEVLRQLTTKCVWDLPTEIIRLLPREYIIDKVHSFELKLIWDRLDAALIVDEAIKELLPCQQHFNLPHHRTHIDGSAPSVKDCFLCQKGRSS